MELDNLIRRAFEKKGFSVVEVLSPCPTNFGRANRLGDSVKMMEHLRDSTITLAQMNKLPPDKTEGKIARGIFVDSEAREYTELYQELCERAQAEVEK
jgi:2-oxoglutarate ferredoxin oxidoreductase subunit beta